MRNYILLFLLTILSTASFAQPLPQEVPGAYNAGVSLYAGILDYSALNNELIFSTDDQLWVTDGSVGGTQLLMTFKSFSKPYGIKAWNGKAYFVANDSLHGYELWITDGTTTGTTLLKDIYPGTTSGLDSLPTVHPHSFLQEFNNKLWFSAKDGVNGRELWSTDGTSAGTTLFTDLCSGSCDGVVTQFDILSAGSNLYFYGNDPVTFGGLYVTDGTIPGTACLIDTVLEMRTMIPYASKVVFTAATDCFSSHVFISDGTVAGSFKLINNKINTLDHVEMNGRLYFLTDNSNAGNPHLSLATTDGSILGTNIIIDTLFAGAGNTILPFQRLYLTHYNNKLVFSARLKINTLGAELYQSDGTTSGTSLIKDLVSGGYSSNPYNLILFNNEIFFQAHDSNRVNIWRSDGTANGTNEITLTSATSIVANNIIQNRSLLGRELTVAGNSLYFYANYFTNTGFRLYKLDVFPTGVKQDPKFSSIDIYPNPSQGFINIDATGAKNITIHSITGSTVYSKQITSTETTHKADIQQLSPGTYTINTLLNDGTTRSGKFVKQ